jgi:hypothetical protein
MPIAEVPIRFIMFLLGWSGEPLVPLETQLWGIGSAELAGFANPVKGTLTDFAVVGPYYRCRTGPAALPLT